MWRFFAVTFGLGWLFQWLAYQPGFGSLIWLVAAMWTPALGALAEGFRPWPPTRLYGPKAPDPLLLRPAAPAALWLVLLAASTVPFHGPSPHWPYPGWMLALVLALTPLAPLVNAFLGALGEELGWRGFLLPRLAGRLGWLGAAVAVGVIWAVWQTPVLLNGYNYGVRGDLAAVLYFTAVTVPMSVLHAAVYLRYGVWGAAGLHGAVNGWAGAYFVLFHDLLGDRFLWGPVGFQGAAVLAAVAVAEWMRTSREALAPASGEAAGRNAGGPATPTSGAGSGAVRPRRPGALWGRRLVAGITINVWPRRVCLGR